MMKTLIIDSASTSDIIGNPAILHDIHDSPYPLRVNTISGHTSISKMGYLGEYPFPVWYSPGSGVNILSLFNVQQNFRCTMDTAHENCIIVHLRNGSSIKFSASAKGLYVYQLRNDETIDSIWVLEDSNAFFFPGFEQQLVYR